MTVVGFPLITPGTSGPVFVGPPSGSNDLPAINTAISSAPAGGTIVLEPLAYSINGPLVITKSLTIQGSGVAEVGESVASLGINGPTVAPYLTGSTITQTTAATDAIQISGTGLNVNLRDFGVLFAPAIMFVNTGHGINARPSAPGSGGGHELGMMAPFWSNVRVFGTDGNHYAFNILNSLYGTFQALRAFGGGGYMNECDSFIINTGNAIFLNPYLQYFAGGGANAFTMKGRGATPGTLNLITWIRPQVIINPVPTPFAGLGITAIAGTNAFWASTNAPNYIEVIQPDFEAPAYGTQPIDFGTGITHVVAAAALMDNGPNAYWSMADPDIAQYVLNNLTDVAGRLGPGTGWPHPLYVSTASSTQGNPAHLFFTGMGAGNAWAVGDEVGAGTLQCANGERTQIGSYGGVEIYGNRGAGGRPTFIAASATDPSLSVIGTQVGAPVEVVNAPTGQTADLVRWQVNGVTLANLTPAGAADFAGIVGQAGVATDAITSGALSQPAFVSGTPQQLNTARDMTAVIAFTATLAAGTCAVALSPDNVTYTTAATLSPGILNGVDSIAIPVPVNWYLRLTFSNGTVVVTEY
jgi:hypothetical protein